MDLQSDSTVSDDLGQAPPKLMGVHHTAFRCRDAEETRAFYEDVLGLPAKAALIAEVSPGSRQPKAFMHLFFELADGKYVAFFDHPDGAAPEKFALKDPFDLHYAFEAESHEEMLRFQRRLHAAGVPCFGPVDHHFVQSIYFADPNGLQLEITAREPRHDEIMEEEAGKVRGLIAEWTARHGR